MKLRIEWLNDDYAEAIIVSDSGVMVRQAGVIDYDTYGRLGMTHALDLITNMANTLGVDIEVRGDPGV